MDNLRPDYGVVDSAAAWRCWRLIAAGSDARPLSADAEKMLAALTAHLHLSPPQERDVQATTIEELAPNISDPGLRSELLDFGLVFVFLSREGARERGDVLVRCARALGREIVPYQAFTDYLRGSKFGAMRQMIRAARRAVPGSHPLRSFVMGLRGRLGLDASSGLRQRMERYASHKESSVGRALYDYYRDNGYALPGERGSWYSRVVSSHDTHHVLAGYPTTPLGEMCVVSFAHGATSYDLSGNFPFVLLQFHLGFEIDSSQIPTRGQFQPDAFVRAYARGKKMRIDLLDPAFDLHVHARKSLKALRQQLGIDEDAAIGSEGLSWAGVAP